jgi:hypothetical protein
MLRLGLMSVLIMGAANWSHKSQSNYWEYQLLMSDNVECSLENATPCEFISAYEEAKDLAANATADGKPLPPGAGWVRSCVEQYEWDIDLSGVAER